MANRSSKRSRAGKKVPSSSNTPPSIVCYNDGSFLWFEQEVELQRFVQKFDNREILPPRFTTGRYLADSIHSNILLQNSIIDFVYLKYDFIHPHLIQAFYSNLKKDEDGVLSTKVNGIPILLSEENIQALTNLPRDGQDIDQYTGVEGILYDEQVLFNLIGIGPFDFNQEQKRAPIKGMFPEFRLIFYIITRILKPRKSNHTTIGREDAKIMHAIISKARINWCKFVLTHMFDSIRGDKPLPYAFLIMHLLEASQINTNVGTKKNRTKHWEIQETSFHGHDQIPHPPPPTQARRPRAQPDVSLQTISEQLTRIDINVSRTERNVRRLSEELHGYFDHVNYSYSHVYSTSTSSDNFDDDSS